MRSGSSAARTACAPTPDSTAATASAAKAAKVERQVGARCMESSLGRAPIWERWPANTRPAGKVASSRLKRLALNSPPIRRSNDALSPLPPDHRRSMDWHFRSRRAEPKGGADPPRPASTGNAERALRALLAASVILPILIFSGVAWIAYRQHFKDAHNRLETMLSVVYEHALKVFETFELAAKYTDELFEDVTDEQLIASEADYHARLKVLTDTLPQLRDIWVIDRNGHPLVSGTIFPMPHHLDLSDRDHFVFHKSNAVSGVFISGVIDSRAADRRAIVIARRRAAPAGRNEFRGVMTTAIAPEYFAEYYSTLPLRPSNLVALVREDGVILARYPDLGGRPAQLAPGTPIFARISASPLSGILTAVSPYDAVERIIAYRRLQRHGIYVVAGVETRTIVHDWMRAMLNNLFFGVPATITMVLLAWIALRH